MKIAIVAFFYLCIQVDRGLESNAIDVQCTHTQFLVSHVLFKHIYLLHIYFLRQHFTLIGEERIYCFSALL